ncbi:prepilin peptidase [Noviherbaspirillum cavernae]|uniref:Prepilin peptidase n=1 Tax=Noviherbaspirillum cavernae TaxID=2320862 RepID=A0A418WWC4_9BURK|nr:prepilin peptidase [Noviherbaspirillum cavernae]RJF96957.1 prepilin peptidase [Noviherbaspirillum cavernae]
MQEIHSLLQLLVMLVADPRTAILFALLIIAAVSDYRTYRIPNWLTMAGAAFALLYSAFVPFSPEYGFLWSLGGLALGFVITVPLYALRAMGAGDVKLIAMVGAFLGVSDTLYAIVCTFIAGGVAAIGYALFHRATGRMLANVKSAAGYLMFSAAAGIKPQAQMAADKSIGKIPYAISIAVGTIGYVVAKQLGYM